MDVSLLLDIFLILLLMVVFTSILIRGMKKQISEGKETLKKNLQCPPHSWEPREYKILDQTYERLYCVKCERYFGDF